MISKFQVIFNILPDRCVHNKVSKAHMFIVEQTFRFDKIVCNLSQITIDTTILPGYKFNQSLSFKSFPFQPIVVLSLKHLHFNQSLYCLSNQFHFNQSLYCPSNHFHFNQSLYCISNYFHLNQSLYCPSNQFHFNQSLYCLSNHFHFNQSSNLINSLLHQSAHGCIFIPRPVR